MRGRRAVKAAAGSRRRYLIPTTTTKRGLDSMPGVLCTVLSADFRLGEFGAISAEGLGGIREITRGQWWY